jgi:hypothetical protein
VKSWLERRWPEIRAQGKARFVMVRGGLFFGGLMTLGVYALMYFAARRQALQLQSVVPLVPALCIPAGLVWGLLIWHWNEFLYRKLGFDKRTSNKSRR